MESCSSKTGENRKRSATYLSLDWLARKIRRKNSIKDKLQSAGYQIDSEFVARSMLNEDEDKGLLK